MEHKELDDDVNPELVKSLAAELREVADKYMAAVEGEPNEGHHLDAWHAVARRAVARLYPEATNSRLPNDAIQTGLGVKDPAEARKEDVGNPTDPEARKQSNK